MRPVNVVNVPLVLLVYFYIKKFHCWWLTGTQLWLLSLRFLNTDRHLGFEQQHPRTQQPKPVTARRAYSSSELKNIRAHQPKCRLQPQLWRRLQDLGLTIRYRSKRGGQSRIPLPPSLSPNGLKHSSVKTPCYECDSNDYGS